MERHRLDLWLKLTCLFKHRSDSAEACKGGHVKLNGERARPSASLRLDDVVEITFAERYRKVVVLALPEKTVSKEIARTMYRDETPALPEPPVMIMQRDRGAGRPTRKERRDLAKWRESEED